MRLATPAIPDYLSRGLDLRINNSLVPSIALCTEASGKSDPMFCVYEYIVSEEKGTVVEVGVYDGTDTIKASRSGHKVIAFEPDPLNYNRSSTALSNEISTGQVLLHNVALSDEVSSTGMTFVIFGTDSHLGVSHEEMIGTDKLKVSVKQDTLDRMLSESLIDPLLLKIDTQGFDLNVLLGSSNILKAGRFPYIIFEYAPQMIKSRTHRNPSILLQILNYYGYVLYNIRYDKTTWLVDGSRGSTSALPDKFRDSFDFGETVFADDLGRFCKKKKHPIKSHPLGCSSDILAVHASKTFPLANFEWWTRKQKWLHRN
jgi:FkbM family methyltransferase